MEAAIIILAFIAAKSRAETQRVEPSETIGGAKALRKMWLHIGVYR